jgi:hypothetical protein
MMSWAWLLMACTSAVGFYLTTAHQRWCSPLPPGAKWVTRAAAALMLAGSLATAAWLLGRWPGVFASLTTWMSACVVLPVLGQGLRRPDAGVRH